MYVKDLVKSYADDLDRIEREYRQRMRKCEAEFTRRYNSVYSQLKSQQVPSSLAIVLSSYCCRKMFITPCYKTGALHNDDVLFVCLFVCLLPKHTDGGGGLSRWPFVLFCVIHR